MRNCELKFGCTYVTHNGLMFVRKWKFRFRRCNVSFRNDHNQGARRTYLILGFCRNIWFGLIWFARASSGLSRSVWSSSVRWGMRDGQVGVFVFGALGYARRITFVLWVLETLFVSWVGDVSSRTCVVSVLVILGRFLLVGVLVVNVIVLYMFCVCYLCWADGSPRRSAFSSGHVSSGAAAQQNSMFPKEWFQSRFLLWDLI